MTLRHSPTLVRTRSRAVAAIAVAAILIGSGPARGQALDANATAGTPARQSGPLASQAQVALAASGALAGTHVATGEPAVTRLWLQASDRLGGSLSGQWSPIAPRSVRPRSMSRKVVFGLVGAVGGFLLGGYIGARIEGNRCACDDPGLQGFVIGAPIGAVTGAFLGVKLAGR